MIAGWPVPARVGTRVAPKPSNQDGADKEWVTPPARTRAA